MDFEYIKEKFIISIMGSELDEYNTPYIEVYTWELKDFVRYMKSAIDYVKPLKFGTFEWYSYLKSILLLQSNEFCHESNEVNNIRGLDELAFNMALDLANEVELC